MRKYIGRSIAILTLLLLAMTQRSYSQSIEKETLKEINYRLAEGLECKQIVEEKSIQIDLLKKQIANYNNTSANYDSVITLLKENNTISEAQAQQAYKEVAICNDAKAQSEKDVKRLRRGRNTWRAIAVVETVVLAGIVYLIVR